MTEVKFKPAVRKRGLYTAVAAAASDVHGVRPRLGRPIRTENQLAAASFSLRTVLRPLARWRETL